MGLSAILLGSLVAVAADAPAAFAAAPNPPGGAVIVNNGSYATQSSLPAACATPAFTSIEAAVSAAVGIETIYVCAGTYDEEVTITDTGLTLLGAEFGVDPVSRTGPETVVEAANGPFQIEADLDEIDGFTIQGATNDPTTDASAFGAGIWSNPGFSGTHGGFTIDYNIIQDNIAGIEADSDGVFLARISNNLIQNNNEPGAGSGNGIETSFGLSNALIEDNTFSGDTNSSILNDAGGTQISILDNTLLGGSAEGIDLLDVSNSELDQNVSIGSTSSATVDLFGGDSGIVVQGNVLASGVVGIDVENPYATYGVGPNTSITAAENCIEGNTTAGFEEDSGGYVPPTPNSLNATQNWWGSASGPTIASNPGGNGDTIIDQDGVVDYSPFLTRSPGGSCPVLAPPAVASSVDAVVEVHTSPSYAGDPVRISSSQLEASCGGSVTFETLQGGTTDRPTTATNAITVVLDDDGNATVVVSGGPCAPGNDVIETDLIKAPYLSATTDLIVAPPGVTASGVTAAPATEIETGDTTSSGNSDVYAVFDVETDPVYAEQTVEITAPELDSRCGLGWRWEPLGGQTIDESSGTELATATLDDDGNAVFVFKGASCAAGASTVIADVEAGSHPTYVSTFTVDAPNAVIAGTRMGSVASAGLTQAGRGKAKGKKKKHGRHHRPSGTSPTSDPPLMTVTASPNPAVEIGT